MQTYPWQLPRHLQDRTIAGFVQLPDAPGRHNFPEIELDEWRSSWLQPRLDAEGLRFSTDDIKDFPFWEHKRIMDEIHETHDSIGKSSAISYFETMGDWKNHPKDATSGVCCDFELSLLFTFHNPDASYRLFRAFFGREEDFLLYRLLSK